MDLVQAVSVVAVVVALATALATLRDRHRPGPALPVAAMLVLAALWTSIGLTVTATDDVATASAVFRLIFPVGALLAVAVLWHALVLAGRTRRLAGAPVLLLLVEPVLVTGVALTDPAHRLLLADVRIENGALLLDFGPLAWVHIAYCFAVVAVAIGWMVVALREAVPAHRRRYVVALLALALPVLGAAVSVGSASTLGASDLTGAGSVVTAAIWWWSGRRDAATSTVPITLPQVLAALGDAVLVVDARGRLVHTNDAAQRMLLAGGAELVAGAHWTSLVPVSTADEVLAGNPLVTWNGRVIDVRRTPVLAAGRANGTVVVLRDVTEVEQLRQDLAEQATRDGLTGLRNRRYLDGVADRMVARARSEGLPLTAVMVDVDHFKPVNDLYGHLAGDEVLRAVAAELIAGTRDEDVWVRFGGEEFLALLADSSAQDASPRAQDLRRRCRELRVPVADNEIQVTVSIGVAELAPGEDVDALLRAVDAALYEAKALGRDQVVARPAEDAGATSV